MTFLLLFCILFNYVAGIKIYEDQSKLNRKKILILTLFINILILFVFKYTVFVIQSINDLSMLTSGSLRLKSLEILLPIGISYYTFHNISYIYDVYKEKIEPTKSLLTYSIYDLFFPLLLSGPIERAEKLIPQIEKKREINSEKIQSGLILILWGIFKKVFVGDNLASFVNMSIDPKQTLPDGLVYFVAFAFAIQLYADFSGYTDVARGLARMMGFELSLNFNLPFISKNPVEFWKRWHISLSTWLRDYVYIPLGGNRSGFIRKNLNLMIVWILGGFWHGATYGYLLWGVFCGLTVVVYNIYTRIKEESFLNQKFENFPKSLKNRIQSVWNIISILFTFTVFAFGFLLFRIDSPAHLLRLIDNMGGVYFNWVLFAKILFFISPILILESLQVIHKDLEFFSSKKIHPVVAYTLLTAFVLQFCLFSVFESKEFYYFQF